MPCECEALGRRVRAARRKAGLTLRELARLVGISAVYLSDLERGNRKWRGELLDRVRDAGRLNL